MIKSSTTTIISKIFGFTTGSNIVDGMIATLIVIFIMAIVGWISKKWLKYLLEKELSYWHIKRHYWRKCKEYLEELKSNVKMHKYHHCAVSMLMAMVAKRTAADLCSAEGEMLYIQEYLDILDKSLSEGLNECIFVAMTKPSDWFVDERNDSELMKMLKRKAIVYLGKQGSLKNTLKEKLCIKRYIVIPSDTWKTDGNRQPFINLQVTNGITLVFCPKEKLPIDFSLRDMAFFKDISGKSWIVESLDFDENTIGRYASSNLPLHIKVRVEDDQGVVNNCYNHYLKNLNEIEGKETFSPNVSG